MQIDEKLFEYLKSKLPSFQKVSKQGNWIFTCPNIKNHKFNCKEPTCTIINGSNKISCLVCGWKGTFFDVVRLLEEDKKGLSDSEITTYLINTLKVDMYKELDVYNKNAWTLIPISKNSKEPIKGIKWEESQRKDKVDWINWLNNGINIAIRTGEINKITVIDVDNKGKVVPEYSELRKQVVELITKADTLVQNTPSGGKHFIFDYDADIPQLQRNITSGRPIDMIEIDIRNNGGYILAQPSVIDSSSYQWLDINKEIKKIPDELKSKLLEIIQVDKGRKEEKQVESPNVIPANDTKIMTLTAGEGRNNLAVSLGGVLINKFSPDDTEYILQIVNKTFFKPPLNYSELRAMLGSLSGYKKTESLTQEQEILKYFKQMQIVTARDIVDSLGYKRAIADKYLSKFNTEGKAIRLGNGKYQFREEIEWSDEGLKELKEYKYRVPLFNDIAVFEEGDVLILGAISNAGKTTIAMNIVREMVLQGVKPYYIFSEAGSRFQKLAKAFDITGKFYWKESMNPLTIELKEGACTIIDWLDLGKIGFEKTSVVLEYLATEMRKKGGILVIFTQLKPSNYDWFAPNLIEHYPTFAAKYIQDNDDKTSGHWDIGKIKEPRGNFTTYCLPCVYNHETKIFEPKLKI